jgi:hypothetical protein
MNPESEDDQQGIPLDGILHLFIEFLQALHWISPDEIREILPIQGLEVKAFSPSWRRCTLKKGP